MSASELGRLPATDGAKATFDLPADAESLVVLNGLAAVIYGKWGSPPTAGSWDFAVPGEAYMTIPRAGAAGRVHLLVAYPGAVPAADVQAVILAAPCAWPPFVGPLT